MRTRSNRREFCATCLAVVGHGRARAGKVRYIPTVTGPVTSGLLGTTLMHEHVLFGEIPEDRRSASVDFAVELLNDAARVGVHTVVDLTPFRDIKLYQEIAARTPVRIVASTGYYLRNRVPAWMKETNDEKRMEERMLREVTEGIDGTGIRAGIIKVAANGTPLSEWEKMVFRAAARVQKVTGAPIGTHAVSAPRVQFDLLIAAGADPHRLFFSHVETKDGWHGRSRSQIAEELVSIAREGGYLLFNNFGQEFYTPWADMVFLMRDLCGRGYGNRLLMSVDCNWEWKKGQMVFEAADAPFFDPGAGKRTYAYMMTDTIPAMMKAGFSKEEIDSFLIENPRRYFSAT